jgi:F-type H+-transporting ATPase subunit a
MNFFPFYVLKPPTKDINTTVTLAVMSMSLVIFSSIRYKSFKGFLKGFVKPLPFMLPFNILEYFIKTMSLSLRLFGNILAAYCVMEIAYFFASSMSFLGIPAVFPALASLYFDLFDGLLQAYIFTFLTLLFIEEGIEV